VKLKYKLYYFEVQNLEEALSGQRPKLVQIGPYAYDEYYVKFDISWMDDGDTVSFNTQKYYVYNQEETGPGLHQDDQITIPYACVVGFEYLLAGTNATQGELLNAALEVCCSIVPNRLFTCCNHVASARDISCHSSPLLTRPPHHIVKCLMFSHSHAYSSTRASWRLPSPRWSS
jgi:hypothetical protein